MKLLILAGLVALARAHSPVLLWPAERFHLPEGQSVLEMMAMEDFQKLFEDKKVVIFHKRTFGLEEISHPTRPLSYLQTQNALALQGVKSIHRLLGSLTSSNDLKFVSLEDGDLASQQELMKKTMDENPGFAAILVGSGSHRLSRRDAEAVPEATAEGDCQRRGENEPCMIYLDAAQLNGKNVSCSSSCTDTNVTITLDGKVNLFVTKDPRGFTISTEKPYRLDLETVWAPANFSYSCGNLTIIEKDNGKDKSRYVLRGLQVWPYKGNSFPESYDCTTWFSSALWAGTVLVLFYIIVLFVAILYLLDVKSNDRFDDPKGKTITVNVSE